MPNCLKIFILNLTLQLTSVEFTVYQRFLIRNDIINLSGLHSHNFTVYRVGNLSPAMGTRNQVGIGSRTGPPAYGAWLLSSRLGSWNRFLAPQRDLSFRLCTLTYPMGNHPTHRILLLVNLNRRSLFATPLFLQCRCVRKQMRRATQLKNGTN
jgi:hypothetical protein